MARTAMINANLPPSLCPYAEAWAVKILNILPTTPNENRETPHSKMARLLGLYKKVLHPFLQHLRIFGATAWLLLKGTQALAKGDKTAPRAIKGRYLGSASRRGHVVYVWIPQKHQISTARDVTIVEAFQDRKSYLKSLDMLLGVNLTMILMMTQYLSNGQQRRITTDNDSANVDYITKVKIQDGEVEQIEKETPGI
jgi:hypothetical protein